MYLIGASPSKPHMIMVCTYYLEFDYSDMDPSDLEDNILLSSDSEAEGEEEEKGHVKQKKKNDFTKAELEKILLKNLSSDDEELDAKVPAGNRKRERIEESFGTKNKKGRYVSNTLCCNSL